MKNLEITLICSLMSGLTFGTSRLAPLGKCLTAFLAPTALVCLYKVHKLNEYRKTPEFATRTLSRRIRWQKAAGSK